MHYLLFNFVHPSVVTGTARVILRTCMGNLHAATCVTMYNHYNVSYAAYLHTC